MNCTRCAQVHALGACPNDQPTVAPTPKVETTPTPGLWAKLKAIATGETQP